MKKIIQLALLVLFVNSSLFANKTNKVDDVIPVTKIENVTVTAVCNNPNSYTYEYDIYLCQTWTPLDELYIYIAPTGTGTTNWEYAGLATQVGNDDYHFTLTENTTTPHSVGSWTMVALYNIGNPIDEADGSPLCGFLHSFDMPQVTGDCCTPNPIVITAENEQGVINDITNTLTYTIPCGENCVTINASNIENVVYNTQSQVLTDLEGVFCVPSNSNLTSFTANITGTDSCGDPYSQDIAVIIEHECCVGTYDECCDENHNLLGNGNFNAATGGGNGAFNDGFVPNWIATDGTPSISGFGNNPNAWMWSHNGNGEAIAAGFNFEEGHTYTICFNITTGDKNTGDPNVANNATVNLVATNNAGVVTGSPNGDVIFQHTMGAYLYQCTNVSITFTPNQDYTQLWIFPFMSQPSDGVSQSEMSIDDIIIVECCNDTFTVEPFWQHPDCPENVCEAEQWPIVIYDSDGNPVSSAGDVTIVWTDEDGVEYPQDIIFVGAQEHWTVTITYSDGCEYTLEYYEDCCDDDVFIKEITCEDEGILEEYRSSIIKNKDIYSEEEFISIISTIDSMLNPDSKALCNPCITGFVIIQLVDADGNPINPSIYDSITWSDGGSGTIRFIPVDTLITVTLTQHHEFYDCEYTDSFIYYCETESCSELIAPTNLQVYGTTLSWDPVPGAVGYIVRSPAIEEVTCECENPIFILPTTTPTNTVVLSESLKNSCFVWEVIAICIDGRLSEPSQQKCHSGRMISPGNTREEIISISPNPSNGVMNFKVKTNYDTPVTIEIHNFYGNFIKSFVLHTKANKSNELTWDGSSLAKGVYFITFKTNKKIVNKTLIVK